MSTEKFQPYNPLEVKTEPQPRFNRIVVIDEDDVESFSSETLIKSMSLAKEIKREKEPKTVITNLVTAERLSDIPELIFLNINNPNYEMNGFEFLEKFNMLSDFVRNKCKIIVLTHSNDRVIKDKILLDPCVIRYFVKPIDTCMLKDFMIS